MFIIKSTDTVLNNGNMAAKLEKMTGKTNDKFYDYAVKILAAMKNVGDLQSFMIGGEVVIVVKIG